MIIYVPSNDPCVDTIHLFGEKSMHTFIMGLVILIVGGGLYGNLCQRVFGPDDRETPAYAKNDGVDYVPMPLWKNTLINLLNIAGTGPILGPIQGILFGPIAFITIPVGCVIGGALHDYFIGMISVREGGMQMPEIVKQNTNPAIHKLYTVFVCLVLFLLGVVFIYTPGDIMATQIFGFDGTAGEASTWIIYSVIFIYYLLATLFPIDKIIGKVYPFFGAVLLLSAIGIFFALFSKHTKLIDLIVTRASSHTFWGGFFANVYPILIFIIIFTVFILAYRWLSRFLRSDKIIGRAYFVFGLILIASAIGLLIMLFVRNYSLLNIWDGWELNGFNFGEYFTAQHFIPNFFVTVACGILSGFHATQTTLVSRTMEKEKEGKAIFYNMMLAEGFIALVWAAGTMAMIGLGANASGITMEMTDSGYAYFATIGGTLKKISATSVVGIVCRNMLGPIGGLVAILGVILLPITSGDTAMRSLRLIIADTFHIDQDRPRNRILLALPVFAAVYAVLIWAKNDSNGFNTIWRYFAWSNQTLAIFALASILIWLMKHERKKYLWMPLIPLAFYSFITCSYICNAKIGLSLPYNTSLAIGAIFASVISAAVIFKGSRKNDQNQ